MQGKCPLQPNTSWFWHCGGALETVGKAGSSQLCALSGTGQSGVMAPPFSSGWCLGLRGPRIGLDGGTEYGTGIYKVPLT